MRAEGRQNEAMNIEGIGGPLQGALFRCLQVAVFLAILALPAVAQAAAPEANDDYAETDPGQTIQVDFGANDVFPTSGSIRISVEPAHGYVYHSAGYFVYRPDPGFVGTDQFIYELCDISMEPPICDLATVTVKVRGETPSPGDPTQRPPIADDDSAATSSGLTVSIDFGVNDVTSGHDSISITTQPLHGSVYHSAGYFIYSPEGGFVGTDSFAYERCGVANNRCDSAIVTISVEEGLKKSIVRNDTGASAPRSLPYTGSEALIPALMAVGSLLVGAVLVRSRSAAK
jgi:hypothetical protein